jgi:uncharacterized protein
MMVPTYVGPSGIEGVGIFPVEDIAAGTPIWILDDSLDLLLTERQIADLPPLQRHFIERYGYPHMTREGLTVLEFDHGRFMNHSADPNTDFRDPETGWAIRDIAAGEEITCNYAEFDPSFVMLPGRKFCIA